MASSSSRYPKYTWTKFPDMNKKQPKPGDLIEISRLHGITQPTSWVNTRAHQHWAVYIGGGYVVHLVVNGMCSGGWLPGTRGMGVVPVTRGMGVVKKQTLEEVVENDRWKINNYLDKICKPQPIDEIVKQAEESIGNWLPFGVTESNCEHFATNLRYGKHRSPQLPDFRSHL